MKKLREVLGRVVKLFPRVKECLILGGKRVKLVLFLCEEVFHNPTNFRHNP